MTKVSVTTLCANNLAMSTIALSIPDSQPSSSTDTSVDFEMIYPHIELPLFGLDNIVLGSHHIDWTLEQNKCPLDIDFPLSLNYNPPLEHCPWRILSMEVHDLLKTYTVIEVPPERLLFKIPATWQGIEASRILEAEGIQTHLTFVYRFSFPILNHFSFIFVYLLSGEYFVYLMQLIGLPYYIVRNGLYKVCSGKNAPGVQNEEKDGSDEDIDLTCEDFWVVDKYSNINSFVLTSLRLIATRTY
ncbi:hypothetical protein FXO37_35916 [Capsicum annuum]|nr:hypothetical protein FXO37_35916 [Capsicum annuum]